MKSTVTRVLAGAAAAGALTLAFAPQAAAYPVGPWGVEGPCVGLEPGQCPWSHSEDGLTWSYKGHSSHYDKTGEYVCNTNQWEPLPSAYCDAVMAAVRALPPMPIGGWLNPGN
ncbi:hypothetical protein GV791_24450 [Nocardia cyriacigeorgica]|uniref:Secreted protein n=2 Tax=Nocardia cyriacigeorgica TaxID=135487 RepID=H6R4L9_NOCCG|nr:hypothetical protein [Nocardia cyriacigeorgica]MBF6079817.1 hypothetical protein [Nocardia cyriacigeorgica]MBF6290145.1 hypothetical protein [Nocardia cyriacigeorgica]MBF6428021.1 hypothetical protein [Nocardia cyriacigeorgica]NEW35693.1 hypothetical protein [Nocardia cyriacigeorgica]CCF63285.1 exported protein of unknown function [Nocardia cyriacigeorgica GUH-2]